MIQTEITGAFTRSVVIPVFCLPVINVLMLILGPHIVVGITKVRKMLALDQISLLLHYLDKTSDVNKTDSSLSCWLIVINSSPPSITLSPRTRPAIHILSIL